MDVTRPQTIIELLRSYGLQPRKRWGQNFLANKNVVNRLLAVAQVEETETVLEIGPGLGVMTGPLLDLADRVVAVEIDPLLCQYLSHRFSQKENFTLVQGDALNQDYSQLLTGPYLVVTNLPYNITGPLLAKLTELPQPPNRAVILVQLEVAARLTARPGTREYGALSLLIQYYWQAEVLFRVGPGNFYPPPRVDSAAVKMLRRPFPAPPRNEELMFRLIRIAFSQRRKMYKGLLAAALGLTTEEARGVLLKAGLDPDLRGETLSLLEFAALTDVIEGLNKRS